MRRRTTFPLALLTLAALLAVPATAGDALAPPDPAGQTEEEAKKPSGKESSGEADPADKPKPDAVAVLHTSKGSITVEFFPDRAPQHVANFLDLARSGFYEGTLFHRVISGYMIQGGDPNSRDGNPQNDGFGNGPRMLKAEFNTTSHTRGILSMARGPSPDSASCQFFIMHRDSPRLDGQYTAFGQVIEGMEVVDAIASVPTTRDGRNRPMQNVVIERIEVKER